MAGVAFAAGHAAPDELKVPTPPPASASTSTSARTYAATADVVFRGSSTLHDFAGRVRSKPFQLALSSNTWSAAGAVTATAMDTANDDRDKNMHRMLEAPRHPVLQGKVVGAPIPTGDSAQATLLLTIRDRSAELPVRITGWTETATQIRFHAAWNLSLKQFALQPPSVLGVIRVRDTVQLEADVIADKTAQPASAPPSSVKAQP